MSHEVDDSGTSSQRVIMQRVLSRREVLRQASSAALMTVPLARPVRAAARLDVKIANAAGALNLTMAELMRQQRFLESFDLAPEMMTVADGTKILGGVVSGSVDVSMASGFGQVFPAVEHGAPIKILAGGALLPADGGRPKGSSLSKRSFTLILQS